MVFNTLVACATPSNPTTSDTGENPQAPGVPEETQLTILVSPGNLTLAQNDTRTLEAIVTDSSNNPVTTSVTWVSSHPTVVSIDSNGVVTAVNLGDATITTSAQGVSSSPVSITVANRWSNPQTWESGVNPGENAEVVILKDKTILLDEPPPNLKNLTIDGTPVFDEQALSLNADWIVIHGVLKIGSESEPFAHKATLTLGADNANEDIMGMGTRDILLMGGTLKLYGATPEITWTKLNVNASAGATTLTLKDNVNWQPSDEVIVATDFFPHNTYGQPDSTAETTEKITMRKNGTRARG
ncbi:MAG: G8 domain-containing protein [Trueperaceae bacterium]